MFKKLETEMIIGDINNQDQVYIELVDGYFVNDDLIPFIQFENINADFAQRYPKPNLLALFHINIPEKLRRQGMFKNILSTLEQRAIREGKMFYVGPFMSDDSQYIIKVCTRNNYVPMHPFGMLKT